VRWLSDRLRAASGQQFAEANHGCHLASKLMVDLARSVNIPLLHVRSQQTGGTGANFFVRTHGGLAYGWGGREPRVRWHTDDIYANTGELPFPLDPSTSKPAAPDVAARQCFDQR
jgi:hypothetical protein